MHTSFGIVHGRSDISGLLQWRLCWGDCTPAFASGFLVACILHLCLPCAFACLVCLLALPVYMLYCLLCLYLLYCLPAFIYFICLLILALFSCIACLNICLTHYACLLSSECFLLHQCYATAPAHTMHVCLLL